MTRDSENHSGPFEPIVGPPLTTFAGELRDLRARAGSPSFRTMAQRSHYSASALADATYGRRLPSRALVEAFATACGADPVDWVSRWKQISLALDASETEVRADTGAEPGAGRRGPDSPDRPLGTVRSLAARLAAYGRRPGAAGLAGVCGGLLAGLLVGVLLSPGPGEVTAGPVASGGSSSGAGSPALRLPANGADPAGAGCTPDDYELGRASVLSDGHEVGVIQLIYSPQCQGGWARFAQDPQQANRLADVKVGASDGRAAEFADVPVNTRSIYTDLLRPDGGCLAASVVVTLPNGQTVRASTDCRTPKPEAGRTP